jgi:AraC-like DNA-binding protein
MLNLALPTTDCCTTKTIQDLPGGYQFYTVPGAQVTDQQGEGNIILTQTLEQEKACIQLFLMHMKKETIIKASTTRKVLALSYLYKNNISCTIEGFGDTECKAGHLRLAHLPSDSCHYATLSKGLHVVLYISAQHLAEQEQANTPAFLQYLVSKHCQDNRHSLVQQNVKASPRATTLINTIINSQSSGLQLKDLIPALVHEYTTQLQHMHRETNCCASDLMMVMNALHYIEEHLKNTKLCVLSIAAHVGASERTLQKAFVHLIGQSPWDYVKEIRLLRGRQLMEKDYTIRIQEVAQTVGVEAEYFTKQFLLRFGCTPSDFHKAMQIALFKANLEGGAPAPPDATP